MDRINLLGSGFFWLSKESASRKGGVPGSPSDFSGQGLRENW